MKGFSSTSSQVFSQKPSELWNVISKENNLNDTHPFCKENEILVWNDENHQDKLCLLYTSPSPRDDVISRMPSSA